MSKERVLTRIIDKTHAARLITAGTLFLGGFSALVWGCTGVPRNGADDSAIEEFQKGAAAAQHLLKNPNASITMQIEFDGDDRVFYLDGNDPNAPVQAMRIKKKEIEEENFDKVTNLTAKTIQKLKKAETTEKKSRILTNSLSALDEIKEKELDERSAEKKTLAPIIIVGLIGGPILALPELFYSLIDPDAEV